MADIHQYIHNENQTRVNVGVKRESNWDESLTRVHNDWSWQITTIGRSWTPFSESWWLWFGFQCECHILFIKCKNMNSSRQWPIRIHLFINHRFKPIKGIFSFRYFLSYSDMRLISHARLRITRLPNLIMHIFYMHHQIWYTCWMEGVPEWVYAFWQCKPVKLCKNVMMRHFLIIHIVNINLPYVSNMLSPWHWEQCANLVSLGAEIGLPLLHFFQEGISLILLWISLQQNGNQIFLIYNDLPTM